MTSSRPIPVFDPPSAAVRSILLRKANPAALVRRRNQYADRATAVTVPAVGGFGRLRRQTVR